MRLTLALLVMFFSTKAPAQETKAPPQPAVQAVSGDIDAGLVTDAPAPSEFTFALRNTGKVPAKLTCHGEGPGRMEFDNRRKDGLTPRAQVRIAPGQQVTVQAYLWCSGENEEPQEMSIVCQDMRIKVKYVCSAFVEDHPE